MKPLQPEKHSQQGDRDRGGAAAVARSRDFAQLALWMAGTLAGIASAVLVARAPFFKSMQRRIGTDRPAGKGGRRRRSPRPPTQARSLPLLAEAIVGNSRETVAEVFGPPRGAVLHEPLEAVAMPAQPPVRITETWYYPIEREEHMAMAIEFDSETARRVEFFKAPRVEAA